MPASLRSLAAVLAFSLGACLPPPLADCGDVSCGDPPLTTGGVASEPTTGPGGDAVQTATSQPTGLNTDTGRVKKLRDSMSAWLSGMSCVSFRG